MIENNLIYNCQYGIEIGSEEKKTEYPVTAITVRGNICRDNSVCAMRIGGYDTKTSGVVMNCEIYNNSFIDNTGDFDVIISMVDNIMFANNIFKTDGGFIETEFSSSYIKNLKFFNNCFDGKNEIEILGKEINVEDLNATYGSGNLLTKLKLDSIFKPETMLVGHSNYTMKYDIYFNKLTETFVGAVS